MNIINCTPHTITIVSPDGEKIIFESSGFVSRVAMETIETSYINGIPVKHIKFGAPTEIPEPKENTLYIVSAMVAQASDRDDLISPDTGSAIRDESGNIIGVPGFVKY